MFVVLFFLGGGYQYHDQGQHQDQGAGGGGHKCTIAHCRMHATVCDHDCICVTHCYVWAAGLNVATTCGSTSAATIIVSPKGLSGVYLQSCSDSRHPSTSAWLSILIAAERAFVACCWRTRCVVGAMSAKCFLNANRKTHQLANMSAGLRAERIIIHILLIKN